MSKFVFDKENLVSILSLTKELSKIDKDISLITVGIFAFVCIYEGTNNTDVGNYFKINKAKVSRNIQILSTVARTRNSGKGLGLIESREDAKDFRKKTLYVTTKGEKLKKFLMVI